MVMRIFITPVTKYTVTDVFGARGGRHEGIDLGVPVGTPVMATANGTVVYAGISGGYGNLVEINHKDSAQSRYGHLSKIQVRIGETVSQGQQIGLSGGSRGAFGSGDSTGPHLHFEIRLAGKPVDPAPLMGGYGGIVTGPNQTGVNAPTTGIGAWADSLGIVLGKLSDPKFWTRTGLFLLGATLLLIAATKIFAMTDTGSAVIHNAGTALKTAVTL